MFEFLTKFLSAAAPTTGATSGSARPNLETLEDRNLMDASSYVRGLFLDILHRNGSTAEVNGWVSALNGGMGREGVVVTFETSQENHARIVQSEFQSLLLRTASQDEINAFTNAMAQGMTEEQVDVTVLSSAEYINLHGNNASSWLDSAFGNELGRAPDPAGKAAWLAYFQQGGNFAAAAAGFVSSHERHVLDVNQRFLEILHRQPAPGERDNYVAAMDNGMLRAQLIESLAETQEYATRHGY